MICVFHWAIVLVWLSLHGFTMDESGESIVGVICARQRQYCVSILIKRYVLSGHGIGICKYIAETRVKSTSFFLVKSVPMVWVVQRNDPVVSNNGFQFNYATYLGAYGPYTEINVGILPILSTSTSRAQSINSYFLLPINSQLLYILYTHRISKLISYALHTYLPRYLPYVYRCTFPGSVDQLRTYNGPLPS